MMQLLNFSDLALAQTDLERGDRSDRSVFNTALE